MPTLRASPAACLAFLGALTVTSTGWAQTRVDSTAPTVDVNIFQPSPGATSFITSESGDVNSPLGLSVGLNLNYARRPLAIRIIRDDDTREDVGAVINTRLDANLMAGLGLFSYGMFGADVGVVLPFTYQGGFQGDAISGAGISNEIFPANANGIEKFSLGDIRLLPKLRIVNVAGGRFSVALFANITLPTGNTDFARENGPVYAPGIAISAKGRLVRGGINFGRRFRDNTVFSTLRVDDEWFAKAALALNLGAAFGRATPIELVGEVYGHTPVEDPFYGNSTGVNRDFEKSRTSAEGDIGLRINVLDRLLLAFGGGGGLVRGYGAPSPRLYATLMFYTGQFGLVDTDKDGVPDNVDDCDDKPEDKDGFEDSDGCPEIDNDKDGVLDEDDQCPNEPEDKDGFRDEDGCPEPDNDNDGLLDAVDKCPTDPEDKDGFMDDDGCPDLDNDNDGVLDIEDKCPNEPEDRDGYLDFDGCPELDNDGDGLADLNDLCPNNAEDKDGVADDDGCPEDNDRDGIPDELDKCPNEAEIYNGIQDEDGCPEKQARSLVNVTDEKIEIKESVQFATGSAKISKKSFLLLDQVASVLRNYKNIKKIRIEGHTDNTGSRKGNVQLSAQRAASVRAYLVSKGIDSSRLTSEGYGPDKPIASNANAKGREINRRVDFIITELKPIGKDVTDDQPKPTPPSGSDAGFEIELPGSAAPAPGPATKAPAPTKPEPKKDPPKSDAPVELQF